MARTTIIGESEGGAYDSTNGVDTLNYGTLTFMLTADSTDTKFTFTEAQDGSSSFAAVSDEDLVCKDYTSASGVIDVTGGEEALVGYVGNGRKVKVAVENLKSGVVYYIMTERRMAD